MSKLWFRPVFVCPKCGSVSYNPNDIREDYCGRCLQFVADMRPPYKVERVATPSAPKEK
jgi:hypothetical protein